MPCSFLQKVCKHHLLVSVSGCVLPSLVDVAFQCGDKRLLIVGLNEPVTRPKTKRCEVRGLDGGAAERREGDHPCRLHPFTVDGTHRLGGKDVAAASVVGLVDCFNHKTTCPRWERASVKSWCLGFELWDSQLLSDLVWAALDGNCESSSGL